MSSGGGGKRLESRDIVRGAAKVLKDDKAIRREDDKSVTEINFVNGGDEHGAIVGWGCPNNEKSIQSYPSPEFLNSLPFIKKFYPTPRWGEGEFTKGTHEIAAISRHSERLAKESSLLQYKAAAKNENNSSETDHASKPLGIFASKNLAASLPSCLAAKKSAFTLAEVLITLGIIGVVAALTIPNVIKRYQDRVTVPKLQKAYSVLNQAFRQSENDNGSSEFWQETDEIGTKAYFEKYWKPYFVEPQLCKTYKECGYTSVAPYSYKDGSHSALGISSSRVFFKTADDVFYFFTDSTTDSSGNVVPLKNVYIDINGAKAPNKFGEDVFVFNRIIGKGIIPNGYKDTYNSLATDCKKYGTQCAAQIIADGWKINY